MTITMVLGIIYPLWGITALLVLGLDKFVIRRMARARVAFEQR